MKKGIGCFFVLMLFVIPLIIIVQIIRQDSKLPDFSASIDQFGLSMRHPRYEIKGFYRADSTKFSGGLSGESKDHGIDFVWYTDRRFIDMKNSEITDTIKQIVIDTAAQIRKNKRDFEAQPLNFWTSPMGHKAYCIDWSFKQAGSSVYGVNAAWYCRQSNRVFKLEIRDLKSNSRLWLGDPLLRKYLNNIKCHFK